MPDITLDHVSKSFGDFHAVKDLDITFPRDTVTCLLGPSGCGKTTLLRMIVGLEQPTSGRVLFGDRDVSRLRPSQRDLGMVFQYPVMYPTLTVAENIALPLQRERSINGAERRRRVDEVLDLLQMRKLADARIHELDSGSRQKVAVGRAVARQPEIILFDEPTTNVEVNAKLQLIRAFKEVASRLQQTIVYVTHDQTEAMTLADRIALMRAGEIVQYDAPRALYNEPTTDFGAWFVGNPGMNFIRREIDVDTRELKLPLWDRPIRVPDNCGDTLTVGIRPEYVRLHAAARQDTVPARVASQSVTIGGQYLLKLSVGDDEIKAKINRRAARELGEEVFVECPPVHVTLFGDGQRLNAGIEYVDERDAIA